MSVLQPVGPPSWLLLSPPSKWPRAGVRLCSNPVSTCTALPPSPPPTPLLFAPYF
jgi:hypothetical protein